MLGKRSHIIENVCKDVPYFVCTHGHASWL
uniref:Uncharacterized protein n=1 Tax=Anguilla anguilla TaxID=7936 RepID=A0A0E9W4K9_ANGAN